MKLVVEELRSTLSQNFDFSSQVVLSSIRLWIYKHLSPSGNWSLVVKQGGSTIATSNTMTSAYLEANTDATSSNYFHGLTRFDFTTPFVVRRGEVTVELTAGTYTFSESSYIGWVKPHENKYFTQEQTLSDGAFQSFGVEFWRYKDRL